MEQQTKLSYDLENRQTFNGNCDSKVDIKLEKLVQRWRDKVYECLVTNKRYEVIIRDNLRGFTQERNALKQECQESESDVQVLKSKLKQVELESVRYQERVQELETHVVDLARLNQNLDFDKQTTKTLLKQFQ